MRSESRGEPREATATLSSRIVTYLISQGRTQADIARMIRVSEGFISLVKSRKRSLTLDHLELLASGLGVPLGTLLLAVTRPTKPLSEKGQELFRVAEDLMHQIDDAVAAAMRSSGKADPAGSDTKAA